MTFLQTLNNELTNSIIVGTVAAGIGVVLAGRDKKYICTRQNLTEIALTGIFTGTFVGSSLLSGRLAYQLVPFKDPVSGFFYPIGTGFLTGIYTTICVAVLIDKLEQKFKKA